MTEEIQEEKTFPVISKAEWQSIAEEHDLSFVEMIHEVSAAALSMSMIVIEDEDNDLTAPIDLIGVGQYKLSVTKLDD